MLITGKKSKDTYESTYAQCAEHIASGNVFAGVFNLVQTVLPKDATVVLIDAGKTESSVGIVSEYPYGEAFNVVSSKAADTRKVTLVGCDYMGQPMKEEITLNNQTAVAGKKAFKKIYYATVATAEANDTITLGMTGVIGVPFMTTGVLASNTNGVKDGTAVTLTKPVATQTATSGDPRGTLNLGSKTAGDLVEALLITSSYVKKEDGVAADGGVFGYKHYF